MSGDPDDLGGELFPARPSAVEWARAVKAGGLLPWARRRPTSLEILLADHVLQRAREAKDVQSV